LRPEQVVWPWCLDRFRGHWSLKNEVVGELRVKYYDLYHALTKNPPPAKTVEFLEHMICAVSELQDSKQLPWILVTGNSTSVLSEIANLMPIAWSLTRKATCNILSNKTAVELFKHHLDEIEREIAYNIVTDMKFCGFLSWKQIIVPVSGTSRQAGHFVEILSERMENKLPTMFTATTHFSGPKLLSKISSQVESILGSVVASMLLDIPQIFSFKSEAEKKKSTAFKI
jgi:hypothetical protein